MATVMDLFIVLQLKLLFFLLTVMCEMFSKVLEVFNHSFSSNVNLFYKNKLLSENVNSACWHKLQYLSTVS